MIFTYRSPLTWMGSRSETDRRNARDRCPAWLPIVHATHRPDNLMNPYEPLPPADPSRPSWPSQAPEVSVPMQRLIGPALVAFLTACDPGPTMDAPPGNPGPNGLTVEQIAGGLDSPVHLTFAPAALGGPADPRLFIVEQSGRIRIVGADGALRPTPFLDITDRVDCCGERGLLSVAFHPDYPTTGWFFVNYTGAGGSTRVERYSVSQDPDVADESSATLILQVAQPFGNHNGGQNAFGPDGMLYIGLGDGGSGGDPHGNGQNPNTLLGSILRIDVDGDEPYAVPADNPFVGTAGARPEIWAYGLRNPWRFSFDRETGELYIADVGQNQWEEINRVAGDAAGLNFGWNVMEASHCYSSNNCEQDGLELPIAEYSHSDGCSVTGGYVYRGSALPDLTGHYFFSDYCDGWVRSLEPDAGAEPSVRNWSLGNLGRITSFGEDAAGELYILSQAGTVYRMAPGG